MTSIIGVNWPSMYDYDNKIEIDTRCWATELMIGRCEGQPSRQQTAGYTLLLFLYFTPSLTGKGTQQKEELSLLAKTTHSQVHRTFQIDSLLETKTAEK